MKKILLLIFALVVACSTAWAVPAKPGIHTVTQPDGSTLQLRLMGDEWHHSFVTADGFTVQQNDDGFFYYVTTDGITKTIAHDAEDRSIDEKAFIEANREQMTLHALYQAKQRNGKLRSRTPKEVSLKAAEVPTSGSPKIPILLIQYSNVSMKHSLADFQAHYNTQTWSVLQYFTDQSNGQFTPQFDIYGIYTLSNTRAYYGRNNNNGDDQRVGTMVANAITAAGSNINWSQYDNDGDGEVDACIVVYAGPGEAAGAAAETIWPCQWYLSSSDYGSTITRNNKTIDKFAVFCELYGDSDDGTTLDGVGTFCHEFSHCLGLPDFYPTDYSNHFGMGSWSVMHGGCDNNNGNRPCSYTAYERNFMGWMNLSTPTEGQTYTIATVDAGGPAYKITSNNANEYYILENIQKTGWNQYAPASGLLVNHVNYNATTWDNNTVNNSNSQGMTIIPADNSLKVDYYTGYGYYIDPNDEVGDLYPYGGNNQLTSSSTPAATLYNSSTNLSKPITDITKNSNGTVSFTYMAANAEPSYVYVLTNTLTAGKEYLIVNNNTASSTTRYALGHNGTTVARDNVTIKSDASVADAVYIDAAEVDATSVWTAASGTTLKNGNYYVGLSGNNNNRSLAITTTSTNWSYDGTNSRLSTTSGTRTYYLRYNNNNNNFSVSTNANSIYIYEKVEVNMPGVPTITNTDPTATTCDVTWTPGDNNTDWNLRYREYVEPTMETMTWDFNTDEQFDDWAILDIDGDNHYWGQIQLSEDGEPDDFAWYSESYVNGVGAVTPDNWLISPEIQFGGELSFYAWGLDADWASEVFNVLVAPSSAIDGTTVYYGQFVSITPDITTTGTKTKYTFDLSAYEGAGYFAIQHHNVSNEFILIIDDVTVTYPSGEAQPEWIYVYSEESPYTITGLTPETTYEVQVQGVGEGGATSNWTESTLFTTLGIEAKTLAWICQNGVTTEGQNMYVIADMLKAVYADPDRGILWCKDLGNQSINPTSIHAEEQVDFLLNDENAQNGRDWDQSNWILLQFTTPTGSSGIDDMLSEAQNKLIKPGTIKGKLKDNKNYILEMDDDILHLVTKAEEGYSEDPYEYNVYCPANFLPENLNIFGSIAQGDGAYTGQNPQNYFFMNPKVQEVCYITYAEWNDLGYFTVPTGSGFKGGFQIGWAYSPQVTLRDGQIYSFHAVINRNDKEYGPNNPVTKDEFELPISEHITVLPVDLQGDDNIITAINTVNANREVVGVEYVNSLGMTSKTPFSGVNIVVTRYSDGSATTVKRVFK